MVDMRLVGVLCALIAQWYMGTVSYVTVLLGALVAYIAFGGYHTIWLIYHTSKRDLTAAARYIRLRLLVRWASNCNYCVGDMFERMVAHNPNKVALIWEDDKWTFQQVSEYSNKVAHYLASRGLKRGDCMALVMTNRPEYVATWLGASKLGVVTALINHNLRHRSLHHCIEVARANTIICGHDMQDVMQELMPLLTDTPVLVSGCGKDEQHAALTLREATNLDAELPAQSVELPEQIGTVLFNDRLLYIYTSGTTGLPKAAIITHANEEDIDADDNCTRNTDSDSDTAVGSGTSDSNANDRNACPVRASTCRATHCKASNGVSTQEQHVLTAQAS